MLKALQFITGVIIGAVAGCLVLVLLGWPGLLIWAVLLYVMLLPDPRKSGRTVLARFGPGGAYTRTLKG